MGGDMQGRGGMAAITYRNRITGHGQEQLDAILFNPANWRIHPKDQQEALEGVLSSVGWVQDVIVNQTTGHLVDGHLRCQVAARNGEKTIPVVYVELTEAEEALILATLDPLAAMAATDKAKLDDLMHAIQSDDERVQKMLTEMAEREGLEFGKPPAEDPGPQIDKAEELRVKWGVESGQLWKLGEHRIICGDSVKPETFDRLTQGEKAQMIFTDPPYGVDYDGGAKKRDKLENDEVGTDIYGLALPLLAKAADDSAPLYLWYADGHAAAAAAAAAAAGYQITAQIIWAKNQAQFVTSAHYKGKHEPCYYAHKKGKSARWFGPNNEVTLWEYDRSPRNDYHPTQKPLELAERAISNSSEKGDIVLDGFLGGGTTLIACERLNRKCRAVEISPAYVSVAIQRWVDMTGGTPELLTDSTL
ncbi:Methyltransferase (modular protein) [Gammaproteobacteria bacterium]